jgi:hypothetical protein
MLGELVDSINPTHLESPPDKSAAEAT